jgi:hypothetical protein
MRSRETRRESGGILALPGDGVHKPPTAPSQRHKLIDRLRVIVACSESRFIDVAESMQVSTPSICLWINLQEH